MLKTPPSNVEALVEIAIAHFRDKAGSAPNADEVATLRRAALKGKDERGLRYCAAGLIGARRQKEIYGEDAMKRARALRGKSRTATTLDVIHPAEAVIPGARLTPTEVVIAATAFAPDPAPIEAITPGQPATAAMPLESPVPSLAGFAAVRTQRELFTAMSEGIVASVLGASFLGYFATMGWFHAATAKGERR